VLIVDDERVKTDTLCAIFKLRGFDARGAYSAEEALKITEAWPPHVGIFDVMLPAMNGVELAISLKRSHPDCGVILFSGAPETSSRLEHPRRNGHRFGIFAKPVSPETLISEVNTFISGGMFQHQL
jgi:DNA-binding response OmpR family regulator